MNRLKELRNEFNLSYRELSALTDLNYSLINRLELGKQRMIPTHVDILSKFFQVTSDYLLGMSDDGIKCSCFLPGGEIIVSITKSDYDLNTSEIEIRNPDYRRIITPKGYSNIEKAKTQKKGDLFAQSFFAFQNSLFDASSREIMDRLSSLTQEQKDILLSIIHSWDK